MIRFLRRLFASRRADPPLTPDERLALKHRQAVEAELIRLSALAQEQAQFGQAAPALEADRPPRSPWIQS